MITEKLPKRPGADALEIQSSIPGRFIQIICGLVYQSSNGLLPDDQMDRFLLWIIDHGNMGFLLQFTHMNGPVARVVKANLLLSAIRLGSEETVQFLLNNGTDPGVVHRISRETALQLSIKDKFDNAEIVRLLLEHGACPNATYPGSIETRPLLCLATADLPRKTSIAKMLILAGADANVSCTGTEFPISQEPPLISAIRCDDVSLMSLLLKRGANPNVFHHWNRSPLHIAVLQESIEPLKALLQAGANANIPYGEGNQADLHRLLDSLGQMRPCEVLQSLMTPIDVAYDVKDGQMVHVLLQAGAHPDGCAAFIGKLDQEIGTTALEGAREQRNQRLIESFLRAGVLDGDPTLAALRDAIIDENLGLVELYGRKTKDINSDKARYYRQRFLAFAVRVKRIELVRLLLDLGVDVNPTSSIQGKSTT